MRTRSRAVPVLLAIAASACSDPLSTATEQTAARAAQLPSSTGERAWAVSPTGNDAGPGTRGAPFRTPQRAADAAQPGDTIVILAGRYDITTPVTVSNKRGTAVRTLHILGEGGPVLRDPTASLPVWSGIVRIEDSQYVTVRGLTLENARLFAFMIERTDHVSIIGNTTRTSGGSGVMLWDSSNGVVQGNDVSDFCKRGAYGSGAGCQEGISLFNVDGFLIADNLVHDALQTGADVMPGGGEGIDAKGASRNGEIRFNRVWNLAQIGIYIDAWDRVAENIAVYGNQVTRCASGVVLAGEMGGTVRNVRVHNNVLHRNGYDGISIAAINLNGAKESIRIYNNTIALNGYTPYKPAWCRLWGCFDYGTGVRVESGTLRDVRIHDNISYDNATNQVQSEVSPTVAVVDGNLFFPVGKTSWAPDIVGSRAITVDPRLADVAGENYRLTATSPALRRAVGGSPLSVDADGRRYKARSIDLGAYQFTR